MMRGMLLIPLLAAAAPAAAQQHDGQVWTQISTIVPVAKRARVTLENVARFSDRSDGLYLLQFGGLAAYDVADGVELGIGYRKFANEDPSTPDEDRVRQTVVARFGAFTTRLWVDQRFVRGERAVGVRVRPPIRYNHRLGEGRPTLFASHESFLHPNATSWGQRSGYDQMRHIVGPNLPIARGTTTEVGYLNQYRVPRGDTRGQMIHALTVQLFIDLAELDRRT